MPPVPRTYEDLPPFHSELQHRLVGQNRSKNVKANRHDTNSIANIALPGSYLGSVSRLGHMHITIGKLRFGFHGVTGILSSALLITSLFVPSNELISLVILLTSLLAVGSYGLLSQAPRSTTITTNIVPPHREAFKRTIAMIGYLNMRLAHQIGLLDCIGELKDDVVGILLMLYIVHHFLPRSDFRNLNTWFFVIPMFLGLSLDNWHQLRFLSPDSCWNVDVVNVQYLQFTLLSSLLIAFMFTLAFRSYMSIKTCYWIAVIVVALLFLGVARSGLKCS